MPKADLYSLLGELNSIGLTDLQVTPDTYRDKYGICPQGYRFDGSSCVKVEKPKEPIARSDSGGPLVVTGASAGAPPGGSAQTAFQAQQAAKAAQERLKSQGLIMPASKEVVTYSTGETQNQYAARQYLWGYAANPVTRLMFPDAFEDEDAFIRTFRRTGTVILTDLTGIRNTDAGDQTPGNLTQLLVKLWRLNRAEWTREQGSEEQGYQAYRDHLEGILRGAANEWKSAPPILIAIAKDSKGSPIQWMFAGNERATIYRALGMPVSAKQMEFLGRTFDQPNGATVLPIQRAHDQGVPIDQIKQMVDRLVQMKHPKNKSPTSAEVTQQSVEETKTLPVAEAMVGAVSIPDTTNKPKKKKTYARVPRKTPHLHQPTRAQEHPTLPARPLPSHYPDSTEPPQSDPTPISASLVVPDQSSEMPSGSPPSELGRVALPISDRPWVDHLKGLPLDTRLKYVDPSTSIYSRSRQLLHTEIQNTFLKRATPVDRDHSPMAIVMMGGPASGKSTVVGVVSQGNFVVCDLDAVKEFIPEYQEALQGRARDASYMAHHEARDITHSIRSRAVMDRKNIVLDGTGQHLASYIDMIRRLTRQGYHCKLIMTYVDPDTGWNRQQKRSEQTGRVVARDVFDRIHSVVPYNFEPLSKEVDDFEVWDSTPTPSKLVWEKNKGVQVIRDPQFVGRFQSQYRKLSAPREWIDVMDRVRKLNGS